MAWENTPISFGIFVARGKSKNLFDKGNPSIWGLPTNGFIREAVGESFPPNHGWSKENGPKNPESLYPKTYILASYGHCAMYCTFFIFLQ